MAATTSTNTATNNSLSASTASFRTSQSATTAPGATNLSYSDNPLTQLPTIDFKFDDLRKRMSDFTVKFDAFIEKGRKRVLEERNEFRGRLGELNEEQRSTGTQITSLQSTLSTHQQVLSREQVEKNEMHSQIRTLETHQANQSTQRDKLKSAIAHTQRQIDAKLQAQREYSEKIDAQSRLNGPELTFWETYLGCRIEGSGEDNVVKVVFVFPPLPSSRQGAAGQRKEGGEQEEREASFELQVPESGGGGYSVVYAKPKLDQVKVERVVQKLNMTRDIATLLKGMRALFVEEMK